MDVLRKQRRRLSRLAITALAFLATLVMVAGSVAAASFTHTVRPGQTLGQIGSRFRITVGDLMRYNRMASPQLRVGQTIGIPGVVAHIVQPGETMSGLARRYGTTIELIRRMNQLGTDRLRAGQTLAVFRSPPPQLNLADLRLLARMIWAEAEGESHLGRVAVGAVILNRMVHPLFPRTLREVLFQPRQFQPVADGRLWQVLAGDEALRAARDAVAGLDPTGGALYFFNPYRSTSRWIFTRPVLMRIGDHLFTY
jgi:N-acetylmuramoyl-L-alanine amidase